MRLIILFSIIYLTIFYLFSYKKAFKFRDLIQKLLLRFLIIQTI